MSLSQTPPQMENSFPSWLRSTSFVYDFVPAVLCVRHQRPNDEMHKGCHLIVNSLETRGDNIEARIGAESSFDNWHETLLSSLSFAYDLVPAICNTSPV